MSEKTTSSSKRLKIRLTPAAERAVKAGHPWVFADRIKEQNRPGELGELAVVYDRQDRFLALGLLDPHSPIRLRILHAGTPQTVDAVWWQARLNTALLKRQSLFTAETDGCRLVSGESDGWPGLVLDRYADTLVLKLYSGIWLPRLESVLEWIKDALQPARVVLRLSRNLQSLAQESYTRTDGETLIGTAPSGPVIFLENGIRFEADVLRGQKTGFFLDQRENRERVGRLAVDQNVLNAFSFSGGFSLYAARGGARKVTDLDISSHALESARRNFRLNESRPAVKQCFHQCVQADAFDWVADSKERFGIVILDPPSLAKREAERSRAIFAYENLAVSGIRLLSRNGVLVAASCSAHVSPDEFFNAVLLAARRSGRHFTELERTGHAADHPATFPEAVYLKCIYLRFG